ncbi:MAG TPA: redoxin domain-containing protein [Gemmatimonadaceae bacterium]|jgi:peroxiredoxin|nr:redoxin domain-containing protein [Gemmatimonadaceae bacterium]
MEAYRDQYAKLFNNGKDVAVIGISTDDDTVQFNWAHDKGFPVFFASDPDAKVAKLYDVKYPTANAAKRVLFVIDPTGHISHVMSPFKEMVEDSYTELAAAVAEAGKKKP